MTGVGAAVDYTRANTVKATLQSALDAALLAGAKDGSGTWKTLAQNVFTNNLKVTYFTVPTATFTEPAMSTYAGTVSTSVATSVLGVIGIHNVTVTASNQAMAAEADNSCILTLDKGQPTSNVALKLNGAPVINLSGCTIRSNTSLDCNGHDGSVTKSIAAGSAVSCGQPKSNAPLVPDIYADMAKNITQECSGARPGVSWNPGTLPTGSGIKTVNKGSYVEYHICGNLTVTGSGYLTGQNPSTDVVIVIENGNLVIDDKVDLKTVRTAIVMTGDNNWSAKVDFPNGAGKQATLSMSPPTTVGNPWQAVAFYMDPKLTKDVNNTWGPGSAFNADGLVYMGNSYVVTDGNTASANSKCTKFVMNGFTTNGSVKLDFAQQNCAALGLKQWGGIIVHLTK